MRQIIITILKLLFFLVLGNQSELDFMIMLVYIRKLFTFVCEFECFNYTNIFEFDSKIGNPVRSTTRLIKVNKYNGGHFLKIINYQFNKNWTVLGRGWANNKTKMYKSAFSSVYMVIKCILVQSTPSHFTKYQQNCFLKIERKPIEIITDWKPSAIIIDEQIWPKYYTFKTHV